MCMMFREWLYSFLSSHFAVTSVYISIKWYKKHQETNSVFSPIQQARYIRCINASITEFQKTCLCKFSASPSYRFIFMKQICEKGTIF